jgi:nitrogen-specific signal transduction histidine kinase
LLLLSIFISLNNFEWANYLVNLPNSISLIFVVAILLNKTIKLSGLDDVDFSNKFISLEKLEIREKKLKLIAMDLTSDELIIFLSPNYEILHFNKAQDDFVFLVLNKKIRITNSFKELFNTTDFHFIFKPIEQILLNKRPIVFEHEMITSKGGHKEWVSINLLPIYDDDSIFIGITILTKNISQKKEIESKYLQQIQNLESIAWRHSHEMRAPLSNILGLAKQLKKSKHLLDEQNVDLLTYLETEAEKLDKIIKANLQQTSLKI